MAILTDPGMILVLIIRLAGPLMIFWCPLAGALLSEFVFDMFDVVIWDFMGTLPKIDYTSFDKPLDLYLLTIMLIVTLRWKQPIARRIGVDLYFYRLAGFILYEFTRRRVVFLIFPNVYYTFFIAYLICLKIGKSHWFDRWKSALLVLLVTLAIKLPQEYVLHYIEFKPWTTLKQKTLLRDGPERDAPSFQKSAV